MNTASKTFLYICLFSSFFSIAQNQVFIDENMQEIDSKTYFKKCKAYVLGCLEYKTKTLVVNKVYKHHNFGKISETEFQELKTLLGENSNDNINDIQSIVLHFKDSLFGYNELTLRRLLLSKKESFEELNTNEQSKLLRKAKSIASGRISSHFKHVKNSNVKCKLFLEKNNSVDFYIFNEDVNYIEKFGENKYWIKNDSLLEKLFFGKYPQVSYIIIKPNGNYFVSNRYISKSKYLQLIKKNDWSSFEQNLKLSIDKNSTFGIGFFNQRDTFANNDCIIEY